VALRRRCITAVAWTTGQVAPDLKVGPTYGYVLPEGRTKLRPT